MKFAKIRTSYFEPWKWYVVTHICVTKGEFNDYNGQLHVSACTGHLQVVLGGLNLRSYYKHSKILSYVLLRLHVSACTGHLQVPLRLHVSACTGHLQVVLERNLRSYYKHSIC